MMLDAGACHTAVRARDARFDGLFGRSLESLAGQFGVSSRHLRRVVQDEYGVTPTGLLRTHRLLFARRLLLDTALPVTGVAFTSGFSSLARFNAAFRGEYGQTPRELRRRFAASPDERVLRLKILYREPFDWPALVPGRVLSKGELQALSEQWRPWRGYAAMHLWNAMNKHSEDS